MPPKKKQTTTGTGSSTADAAEFEKLGVLYLGRPYDLAAKQAKPGWLLYDSKDLVTHAVCVGMTGSGKTGLCVGLLEEAAIDGIPAIVIDPKGDLANLLLTFPQLRGEDFAPWINEDDARKKGLSAADFAAQQAALWEKGLGDWGQSGERIKKMRDAADFAVYTPGSNAGLPVSILKSFAAPSAELLDDAELLRERIGTTVTSLLGLIGVEADPIKSREHILLSSILDSAWRAGRDLDLPALIHQIQTPPMTKVGVLDVESFFPSKERFALAMQLNNLLAAPGFAAWMEGEALDVGRMLYGPSGKPRIAIFSIAHLNDAERMFFVSLLLNQTLGWVRGQSGTTSLRAILYMDEIFGYFPPVANPPSKAPLLTLLKQARAFGLGVVLATQNPVDLDYKGLANTGTWFIGRLQTERDKARVMEGLEGAAASSGKKFDRRQMEQILAGLGNRVFLLNNVHEDAPEVFQTRWTLSYLRGPLTRTQIKQLMDPIKRERPAEAGQSAATPVTSTPAHGTPHAQRPMLPPEVPQYFLPVRGRQPEGQALVYQPMVLGVAQVRVADNKAAVDVTEPLTLLTPVTEGAVPVEWDHATIVDLTVADLGARACRRGSVRHASGSPPARPSNMTIGRPTCRAGCSGRKKSSCSAVRAQRRFRCPGSRSVTFVCGCNRRDGSSAINRVRYCERSIHPRSSHCRIVSGAQNKWWNGSRPSPAAVRSRRPSRSAPLSWGRFSGGKQSAPAISVRRRRRSAAPAGR
jgi:hypothetical protein